MGWCCVQDLQAMKIGSQHVYKIWRSLVEYRSSVEVPATSDCLCTVVPACVNGASAPVVLSPTGHDPDRHLAVLASTAGGDVRICDGRPPGRPKIPLKDDHNYC